MSDQSKNNEDNADMYMLLETVLRCLFSRTIISDEAEGVVKKTGKQVDLQPLDNIQEPVDQNQKYEKVLRQSLSELGEVKPEERKVLRDFIVQTAENLRFRKFEENKAKKSSSEYNLESDKLKNINRDELGQLMIKLAKEEIEKNGFVPDNDTLLALYESKFGPYIQYCDLYDLGLLIEESRVIAEAAEKKQIDNIVRLVSAFQEYLKNKKEEKEKKTRIYLAEKLEKMAA